MRQARSPARIRATKSTLCGVLVLASVLWTHPARAADGGWIWQNPVPTGSGLNDVVMVDAQTAVAVGEAGAIVRTTDGGASWRAQSSGTTRSLRGVSFNDALTGTAVGDAGTIVRTTNGGQTWTPQSSGTTADLRGVSFTDSQTGAAVGGGGTILRTGDGGATWVRQLSGSN